MVSIPALSTTMAARSATGGAAPSSGSDFAQALAGATDGAAPSPDEADAVAERQGLAADGKDLPDHDSDSDDDSAPEEDATPPTVDLSWLVPTLPVPSPSAPATTAGDSGTDATPVAAAGTATPAWLPPVPDLADDEETPEAPPAAPPPTDMAATPGAPASPASATPPLPLPADGGAAAAPPTDSKPEGKAPVQTTPADPASPPPQVDAADPVAALAATLRARVEGQSTDQAKASAPAQQVGAPPAPPVNPPAAGSVPASPPDPAARQAAAQSAAAATTAPTGGRIVARDDGRDDNGAVSLANAPRRAPAGTETPPTGVVQPAGRAFAAAIAAAVKVDRRTPGDQGAIDTAFAAGSLGGTAAAPVAADTGTPVLDTRDAQWMGKMIDHIEVLRDAVDATDTRIRLVPDALGKIDVAIQHDGDRINVRFTAEQPETRQLLTDAQPRLAEIAASRGVRIGQSTIDSGHQGNSPQQQQQRQPETARQPIANRLSVKVDGEETTDAGVEPGWIA